MALAFGAGVTFADSKDSDAVSGGFGSPEFLARVIRARRCPSDSAFDRFLPDALRAVSNRYWTPLRVALRVAEWLDWVGARQVLDIGSGAGKFCVAAALGGRARYTGLEHRPKLVDAARELACLFGVEERVSFVCNTLGNCRLPRFDALYLFNPFGENLLGGCEVLDDEVELNEERFLRDVAAVEHVLDRAPVGSYLVTYNGFGGTVPSGYQRLRSDPDLPNVLYLWKKVVPSIHRRFPSSASHTNDSTGLGL